jgi:methionine-gamma-lyase
MRSRTVHGGEALAPGAHPLADPIHQGAVYAFADSRQADRTFAEGGPLYARDGLPNVRTLERAVASLEGADDAIAVSSGMAAIAMTMLTLLEPGEHVVLGNDGYCDTTALLMELARKLDLRIDCVNLQDPTVVASALRSETRLVLAETISNPGMRVANIPMLSSQARRRGALLIVDNTFATPVLCRPLEHGADAVIHSAGKFLGGHSDATAGVVAGTGELIERIRRAAYLFGPLLAPMDAWLILRGMKTLLPRMHWASQSARRVAEWLRAYPAAAAVNYPALDGHPRTSLDASLLPDGAGALLTFRLAGGEAAALEVLDHLSAIPYAPSVGGPVTIASFPPMAPAYDVAGQQIHVPYRNSTIRLSVGLEDPADIIADLEDALAAVLQATPLEEM